MTLLSKDEISLKLIKHSGWKVESKQLAREFQFRDFVEALDFVNKVGVAAEEINHHPDIFLHSWNKVKITVSTHSEGGITNKDFQLVEKIENVL
jgi:4a-hydroxytetrahydrobiopterin dehydratase